MTENQEITICVICARYYNLALTDGGVIHLCRVIKPGRPHTDYVTGSVFCEKKNTGGICPDYVKKQREPEGLKKKWWQFWK